MSLKYLQDWVPFGNVDPADLNALIDRMLIGFSILLLPSLGASM